MVGCCRSQSHGAPLKILENLESLKNIDPYEETPFPIRKPLVRNLPLSQEYLQDMPWLCWAFGKLITSLRAHKTQCQGGVQGAHGHFRLALQSRSSRDGCKPYYVMRVPTVQQVGKV